MVSLWPARNGSSLRGVAYWARVLLHEA